MGFFSDLFGGGKKAKPPTQDEFAQLVIDDLVARGVSGPFEYDAAEFRILAGAKSAPHVMNLTNAFREYVKAPPEQHAGLLAHYFGAHLDAGVPDDFRVAAPNLLPIVRPRTMFEMVQMRAKLDGMDFEAPPLAPLGEHLVVGVAFDTPRAIAQVSAKQYETWGVTFEQALEKARANLWQISEARWIEPRPGLYLSPFADTYDASRLFLTDLVTRMRVEGDPVAICPNRNVTIITGSEDREGLLAMLAVAQRAKEEDRNVTTIPVRFDGARWSTWHADEHHEGLEAFAEMRYFERADEYATQKAMLQELVGDEWFVATANLVRQNATGQLLTYATWTDDVPTYLPEVDEVMFVRVDDAMQGSPVGRATMARVRELLGHHLEPVDCFPPRYRTIGNPTPEELAAFEEP